MGGSRKSRLASISGKENPRLHAKARSRLRQVSWSRLSGRHDSEIAHFGTALEAFATSLRLCRRRGEPPMPDALEGMAAVWATLGERERAARTAGAAQRIREQLAIAFPEHPNRPLPEPVEPAWSEGRAMSAEEAVEYALSSLTDA